MRNQRSQHFSYAVIFSILLNALYFLQYVNGDEEITTRNAQNLMTSFPTETTVSGYPDEKLVQLRMFGGIPEKANDLVCTGFNLAVGDQFWIKQIKGVVIQSNIAMNLYGCNTTVGNPCSCPLPNRSLLFSWNRHTPPFRFGSNFFPTGFSVGVDSQIKSLFLETRYGATQQNPDFSNGVDLQITRVKPYYVASIYSVLVPFAPGTGNSIPSGQTSYTLDACLTVPSTHPNPIRTIAYRTNAVNYGVLASGYVRSSSTGAITELGRGNPTFPQAFYVAPQSTQLNAGDTIMVRCVFNSVSGFVGSTGGSQACIYNIMWITPYFVPAVTTNSFLRGTCTAEQKALFPESSMTLLPANTVLETHAVSGGQTGIVTIDSTHLVNLDLETYAALYP